jgi:hypothetical protein
VDAAALAAANRAAVAHIKDCVVCAVAYVVVQRRGSELEALGDIDSTSATSRDQLYAETRDIYCEEGQRLVMTLGQAAMGAVEPTS